MKNIDLMIERAFLDDGSIVAGPAAHLRNVTEDELDELIGLALRLKLDPESRSWLSMSREELRTCVDWFISVDQQYGALRHISFGEWVDFQDEADNLGIKRPEFNLGVRESIEYFRAEIAKNPKLQIMAAKQNCVTVEKLVRRVNLQGTRFNSITSVEWEIERNLSDLEHASVISLVLAYIMGSRADEHGRHIYQIVENRLKWILEKDRERLEEFPGDFHELLDLRGLTLKELKKRRARGQKTLEKFLNAFPEDFFEPRVHSELFPVVRISFDRAVQEFCERLTDDELLEFLCVYATYTNGRWDARSKTIAMAAETRMRRQFE